METHKYVYDELYISMIVVDLLVDCLVFVDVVDVDVDDLDFIIYLVDDIVEE